jgi:PKD repeat protein
MGNNNTAGIFVTIPAILLLFLLSFSSPPLSITTTMAQQIPLTPPSLTSPTTPLASAQEESTSSPPLPQTLPFTPFSLQQQQEAVPEEEGIGNTTGTTTTATPATNDTEGGVTELTSSATEPPLRVEAIANATQAVAPATIRFDANITGGAPPYSYSWSDPNLGLIDLDRSITLNFFDPGTFTYILTVTDSRGKTVTDNVQIVISERVPPGGGRGVTVVPEPGGVAPPGEEGVPLTVEIIPNATQAVAPATFQFDSKVTGGTEPYNYRWKLLTGRFTPEYFGAQLVLAFQIPGTYTIVLNVTDSTGRAGSDSVEITIGGLSELPPSDIGEVVSPPPEGGGVLPPPETGEEGGELPGGLPPSPADDTEGEEGTPPSTREEEPPTNDTGGG